MSSKNVTPTNSRNKFQSLRDTTPSRIQTPRAKVPRNTPNNESSLNTAFAQPKKTPVTMFMKSKSINSPNLTPKSSRKAVTFDQKTPECFTKVSLNTSISKKPSCHSYEFEGEFTTLFISR